MTRALSFTVRFLYISLLSCCLCACAGGRVGGWVGTCVCMLMSAYVSASTRIRAFSTARCLSSEHLSQTHTNIHICISTYEHICARAHADAWEHEHVSEASVHVSKASVRLTCISSGPPRPPPPSPTHSSPSDLMAEMQSSLQNLFVVRFKGQNGGWDGNC